MVPDKSLNSSIPHNSIVHHELRLVVQKKRGHKSEEYNKLNETHLYFAHDKWQHGKKKSIESMAGMEEGITW